MFAGLVASAPVGQTETQLPQETQLLSIKSSLKGIPTTVSIPGRSDSGVVDLQVIADPDASAAENALVGIVIEKAVGFVLLPILGSTLNLGSLIP